jgi:hypothetical protein
MKIGTSFCLTQFSKLTNERGGGGGGGDKTPSIQSSNGLIFDIFKTCSTPQASVFASSLSSNVQHLLVSSPMELSP